MTDNKIFKEPSNLNDMLRKAYELKLLLIAIANDDTHDYNDGYLAGLNMELDFVLNDHAIVSEWDKLDV